MDAETNLATDAETVPSDVVVLALDAYERLREHVQRTYDAPPDRGLMLAARALVDAVERPSKHVHDWTEGDPYRICRTCGFKGLTPSAPAAPPTDCRVCQGFTHPGDEHAPGCPAALPTEAGQLDTFDDPFAGTRKAPPPSTPREELADAMVKQGSGDDDDVEAGRCCPHCRNDLTDHNRAVYDAAWSMYQRHDDPPKVARSLDDLRVGQVVAAHVKDHDIHHLAKVADIFTPNGVRIALQSTGETPTFAFDVCQWVILSDPAPAPATTALTDEERKRLFILGAISESLPQFLSPDDWEVVRYIESLIATRLDAERGEP